MIYQSKGYRILDVIPQTGDNIMLRVKTALNPLPGQFVEVSVPGLGECPISSASFHSRKLDLNIRIVGSITEALSHYKKGDKIFLRGPYGQGYPMKELEGRNLVLIGGGCGVAPLRGIIEYLQDNRDKYKDVNMFFGYRTPDDVLFKEEMDYWKEEFHLHLSVNKSIGHNPFNCPVGFVTEILKDTELDTDNTAVLICGPPIMMEKTIEIINEKGFQDDDIYVSFERHMKCSNGKCGHCMVHGMYICVDGPVFRYDKVRDIDE